MSHQQQINKVIMNDTISYLERQQNKCESAQKYCSNNIVWPCVKDFLNLIAKPQSL